MLLRAAVVLPVISPPLNQGAIRVEGSRIIAVGSQADLVPLPEEEVIDLPDSVVLPGLINAHCHLDYSNMKGAMSPTSRFTEWIKKINALKRHFGPEDYLASIADGFKQLMDTGTTSVGNIVAFPDLLPLLPMPPIRTWWFLELIDLRSRLNESETLLGALQFFENHPNWLGGFGLSPHAPYTASIELYRLAKQCSEQYGMPFTTHIAESREEQEMFLYAKGPLYEFLKGLGRDCSDCGQGSSLSHLVDYSVLTKDCLAIHLNCLQEYDWKLLVQSGVTVVHCPKSHFYFSHPQFPLERMRKESVNLCIATDSLASNNSLDLRSEIRHAAARFPEVSPAEWIEMVTINPARCLHQNGLLGRLAAGALADLVAFPHNESLDPYASVIQSRAKPDFLMVNGRKIDSPPA